MLVDPTPVPTRLRDPVLFRLGESSVTQVQEGVWMTGLNPKFAFINEFREIDDTFEYEKLAEIRALPEEERFSAAIQRMENHQEAMRARYRQEFDLEWRPLESYTFYGVCDSLEQILTRFPHLALDPQHYCIFLCEMRKEDQPSSGGWRWHKWGEYIGDQRAMSEPDERGNRYGLCEYLYHEPTVESVLIFHVYEIVDDLDRKRFFVKGEG